MAIEAMKQTAGSGPDTNAKFSGFRMKDVFFQSPLIVPTNQSGVDTQFTLLAAPRILDKSLNWSEFRLYAFSNNEWTLVCRGHIRPTNGERNSDFNNGRELRERNKVYENIYQTQDESCTSRVDSDVIYQHLASCGLQYGPAFRRLNHISYNAKGDAIGELDLFRWTAENSSNHVQEHVIHPTSLDGLFQLSLIGTSRGEDQKTPTMVPTRINSMWISNERLSYPSSNSITVCAKSVPSTISQSGASIFGLDRDNKAPLIIIHGLQATIVANDENVQSIPNKLPRLCYSIDWKPDMSLMSSQEKLSYCEIGNADTPEPVEFSQAVHFMVLAYITKTLKVVDRAILATAEPHYQKYVRWMEFQAERFHAGALHDILPNSPSLLEDIKYQDALSTSLAEGNVQGKTYVEIGQNLVDILHGSVDPLALLFQTNLAAEYYAEISNSARFLKPMQRYMQALAHKDPSMRILEIGAGTGGVTTHMLNSLMPPTSDASAETSTPMYDSYDFTDISRSFFPEAQRKFVHHGSRLNYSILNIDEDPELQGFENNTYDMVIAASALHVTKDLNLTIRRIRKLLKIGGKLVLVEPTKPDQLGCNFIFGLLPGWWPDGTDGRETGPLVTEAGWNDICTRNGFSQVDITFTDYQNESCQESSIMIFTAVDTNEHTTTTEMPNNDAPIIMIRETSNLQLEMSHMLQAHFLENGYLGCEIVTLSEASKIDALGGKSCISLLEVDASAIWNFTLSEYKAFQLLIRSKVKLLWVKGAVGSNGGPNRGVVDGLSRVLRAEDTALVFVTLELEISEANKTHNLPRCVKHICQVLSTTSEHAASHSFEPEYKEIDGLLQIKRIVEERPLDRHISIQTCRTELRVFQLDQGPPLRISVGTPGLLESLQLIHDKSAGEPLQKQHIEVQTHAIGLNFMDLLTALGRLGDGTQIGTECAGIVSRVGDDAKGYFKIGDRVLVAYSDTCRTYVRCHYQCAVILPSNIPFTLAAGLPTTFGTAYHSLHKVARLQKGETLLIHSAAGGTGQSAIQIGLEIGAEIFATVGSQIKKEFLMETYGLSEDHIFSSRDTVFAESVLRMTKGEGVDVVLNSLSGEGLIASWECIAPYGRFIEIGKKDIQSAERLPMLPFARNVSFSAVDMAAMTKDRPHYMQSLLTILIQKMEQGQIRTSQPLQVYKLSEMEQAFRHLQSGQSRGKLVLEVDREKEIEV
ncbi:hypothetical protein OCU04_010454 [Sclerotinia nivalis]|uniref:PKS/mFAS DH domain-containing protein n=1 Tax=Sclerotinia nivalis TaxID=352851 RepID=A0A9X0DHW8_9HELO|nr:hypothetical protein OCU04_010454 [Sclerotinia nivalis]